VFFFFFWGVNSEFIQAVVIQFGFVKNTNLLVNLERINHIE